MTSNRRRRTNPAVQVSITPDGPVGSLHDCDGRYDAGHDCPLRCLGHTSDWLDDVSDGRVRAAFAAVLPVDEVAGLLAVMSRADREEALSLAHVPPMRKPGRAAVEAVWRKLQGGGPDAATLTGKLTAAVTVATSNADGLDLQGQLALARGGVPSAHAPFIRDTITGEWLGLLRLGLALQLERDATLAAFALGWLACHPAGADERVVEELQAGWAKVRAAHPELPEVLAMPAALFIDEFDHHAFERHRLGTDDPPADTPVDVDTAVDDSPAGDHADGATPQQRFRAGLADGQDGADVLDTTGTAHDEIGADTGGTDATPDEDTAAAPADPGVGAAEAWLSDPAARAEELAAQLGGAADELRAGSLPTNLERVHRDVGLLRDALATWAGQGLNPATVADLRAAGSQLAEQQSRLLSLRRAFGIDGPARFDVELDDIRSNADPASELADAVLALVDVIDWVGANPGDPDGLDDRSDALAEALPAKWSRVTIPAITGRLTLPPAERPEAAANVVGSGPLAARVDAPGADPEPVADTDVAADTAADGTEGPEPDPPEMAGELNDVIAPAEPADLDDLAAELEQWAAELDTAPAGDPVLAEDPVPLVDAEARTEPPEGEHVPAAASPDTGTTTPAVAAPQEPAAPALVRTPRPAAAVVEPAQRFSPEESQPAPEPVAEMDLDVDSALLDADRAAAAAWLREAHGDLTAASVRRAAALSGQVRGLAGRCATAFTDTIAGVDQLPRGDADRLLLAASCMRAGLVAPSPEAAGVLDSLAPVIAGYPHTAYLASAFSNAAATGVLILPVADTARASSKAHEARNESADAARRLLADGPTRTLRYANATDVWTAWVRPDGLLGAALTVAASDDPSRAGEVEAVLDRFSSASRMNREIDQASAAARRTAARQETLHARARERLVAMVDSALEVLRQWRDDVRAFAAVEQASPRSWQAGPLAELRHAVAEHRDGALAELDGDGAIGMAGRLLADACSLLDGRTLDGDEPDPVRVLDAELLGIADLPLAAGSLRPAATPTPEQMRSLAAMHPDPVSWFEARASVDDHQGTAAVLSILRDSDAAAASRLAGVRDQQVTAAAQRRDARYQQLRSKLDRALRHGLIDHTGWVKLTGQLTALGQAGRVDFAAVAAGIDDVEVELEVHADQMRQTARERLAGRVAADDRVKAVADVLTERIDADDLTAFEEYLALAESGQELPAANDNLDHLAAFFPRFPAAAAAHPASRRSTSSELLRALHTALNSGDGTPHGQGAAALEALLIDAGVSLRQLPEGRRQNATSALGKWMALGQGGSKGLPTTALHAILALLGLEFSSLEAVPEGRGKDRELYELRGVRGSGKAMLPAFGSAKSPSGDSLRVALVWNSPEPITVIDAFNGQPGDRTVLVLYFGTLGPDERRGLAAAARRRRRPSVLVLDDAALMYLACQHSHTQPAAVEILAPFSGITPFTPLLSGDVPVEMFYGRLDERRSLTDSNGSCFVFGGRQLGKSALLRAAARDFDNGGTHRAVVASIYSIGRSAEADRIWPLLWTRLTEAGVLEGECPAADAAAAFRVAVNGWLAADTDRQLLLLLDEADAFLDEDAATASFAAVNVFRDLMTESRRRVKVVFAGLHQTARFEQLGNQPLAHFGSPVSVGPLNPQAAYDLLTEPLRALGYRFVDESVPARVLALANNAPALVQLFGAALLDRLLKAPLGASSPPVEVTAEDVEAVWADQALMSDFRNRFEWTLNLDARYKVIAYDVAFKAMTEGPDVTLSAAELRNECSQWWPTGFAACSTDEFRGLLSECVELGVLTKIGDGYRLRSPNLLRLLGTADEVEQVLTEADGWPLPETFDAAAYRPQFASGPTRSPLSDAQSRELLAAGNQVFVVSGSAALRLERVPRALADAASQLPATTVLGVGHTQRFPALLASAEGRAGHVVVVAELHRLNGASPVEAVTLAVDGVRRRTGGTLSVVLLAGPAHVDTWLSAAGVTGGPLAEHARLVELGRLDQAALRLWMAEESLPFQDEGSRSRLLEVTGGWPVAVDRIVETVAQPLTAVEEVLASAESRLDQPANASALLEAVGVVAGTTLGEAWRIVVELGAAPAGDIVDLLESDTGPLSEHEVAAAGLGDLRGVVEALRILGALEPGDGGLLHPQPVLARATRALA